MLYLTFQTGQQNSNQFIFPALAAALTILVYEVVQFVAWNYSKNMFNKTPFLVLLTFFLCLWMVGGAPQIKTFFSIYNHRPYFGDAGVANYDVKYFGTFGSPNSFGEHF